MAGHCFCREKENGKIIDSRIGSWRSNCYCFLCLVNVSFNYTCSRVRGVWTYWMGGSGLAPLPGDGVMSQVGIIRRTNVPLQRHFPCPTPAPGRYNTSSDDPIMDIHAV